MTQYGFSQRVERNVGVSDFPFQPALFGSLNGVLYGSFGLDTLLLIVIKFLTSLY